MACQKLTLCGVTLLVTISILAITLETDALSCYVCKKSSQKNYAEAENYCNAGGLSKCREESAKGCMVEGFTMEFLFHVVKRCVRECPVFVNSSSELIRCCSIDGCNDFISKDTELDFRREEKESVGKDVDANVNKDGDPGDVIVSFTTPIPLPELSTPIVIRSPAFTVNPRPAAAHSAATLEPPPPGGGGGVTAPDSPQIIASEGRGSGFGSGSGSRTTRRQAPGDGGGRPALPNSNNHHRHHQFRPSQFEGGQVSCRGSRSGSAAKVATFASGDLLTIVCLSMFVLKLRRGDGA